MTTVQEHRNQSIDELEALIHETRRKLFDINNQKVIEKTLEKPHQKKLLKREIARLLTVLKEKQKV